MKDETVVERFNALLAALAAEKSDKRTDRDRYVAITMTNVEEAFAVYIAFCALSASPHVTWNK